MYKKLIEIGKGFWNIRGTFKILGLYDIQTQMSVLQLNSGNFVVVDCVQLTEEIKTELNQLTENGTKVDAFLAVHPFHTEHIKEFCQLYPTFQNYYGCPRHQRQNPAVNWKGLLNDPAVQQKWEPEISLSIPAGSNFIDPKPESTNHFSSVLVYHKNSRTIHVDDTITYIPPDVGITGALLSLTGWKSGYAAFHPAIKGAGLLPEIESPYHFRDWVKGLLATWDFDNICTAHMGNKVGGAKEMVAELLKSSDKMFEDLVEERKQGKSESQKVAKEEEEKRVKALYEQRHPESK